MKFSLLLALSEHHEFLEFLIQQGQPRQSSAGEISAVPKYFCLRYSCSRMVFANCALETDVFLSFAYSSAFLCLQQVWQAQIPLCAVFSHRCAPTAVDRVAKALEKSET